jgi:hypothetical protein
MKGIWNFAVRQHGGPTPDCRAVNRYDDWLFKGDEGVDQTGLRTVPRARGIFQKIVEVVSRAERVSRSVPKHDTYVVVLRGGVEQVRDGVVHR